MIRLTHWERLLAAHFERLQTMKFEWGVFDCALAVCDGVNAITGTDPGVDYRGKYHSQTEAAALIGGDLGAFAAGVATRFQMPETRPTFARRGDVVLVDNGDPGHALGTVDHTGCYARCAGERGTIRVSMRRWLRAWKVG